MVRPLYVCRVEDLGQGDLLVVECGWGHTEYLTPAMLKTAGVKPYTKLLDLKQRLKCKAYRWKGRAVVSVRWVN
jgi:hypothetical protein